MENNAVVFIPLTQGKVAVIDFEDFEKVRPYKWHAQARGRYASTDTGHRCLYLHRLIAGAAPGEEVHHRDGDGLNNRKENLQRATRKENARGFWGAKKTRGVGLRKDTGKWRAYIEVNGEHISLGSFVNREEALQAYNDGAKKYFGEVAHQNSI